MALVINSFSTMSQRDWYSSARGLPEPLRVSMEPLDTSAVLESLPEVSWNLPEPPGGLPEASQSLPEASHSQPHGTSRSPQKAFEESLGGSCSSQLEKEREAVEREAKFNEKYLKNE